MDEDDIESPSNLNVLYFGFGNQKYNENISEDNNSKSHLYVPKHIEFKGKITTRDNKDESNDVAIREQIDLLRSEILELQKKNNDLQSKKDEIVENNMILINDINNLEKENLNIGEDINKAKKQLKKISKENQKMQYKLNKKLFT